MKTFVAAVLLFFLLGLYCVGSAPAVNPGTLPGQSSGIATIGLNTCQGDVCG